MTRHYIQSAESLRIAIVLVSLFVFSESKAKDFGVVGETFIVAEKDMLNVIQQQLVSLQQSGKIYHLQNVMKDRLVRRMFKANIQILKTTQYRRWEYDPTFIVAKAIYDHQGKLLHKGGAVVNPLTKLPITMKLFFIDGEDKAQVRWAVKHYNKQNTKIILTRGNPFTLMHEENVRFFFDQNAALSKKLGVRSFPAVSTIQNHKVIMEEIVLP